MAYEQEQNTHTAGASTDDPARTPRPHPPHKAEQEAEPSSHTCPHSTIRWWSALIGMCAPRPPMRGGGTQHHTRSHRVVVSGVAGPSLSARGSSPTAGSGAWFVCVCWCNTLKQTNTDPSQLGEQQQRGLLVGIASNIRVVAAALARPPLGRTEATERRSSGLDGIDGQCFSGA